jgi:hypothetical protein
MSSYMWRFTVGIGALVMLAGCGNTASNPPAEADANGGAGGQSNVEGLGPIDEASEPTSLHLACGVERPALNLALPCRVGLNLNGKDEPGYHVVECTLADTPGTAVSFTLPLVELPQHLNEPMQLPFALPPPPSVPGATLGDEHFVGELKGTITFSQLDLPGRAFVGDLHGAHFAWSGDKGTQFECGMAHGTIWGVAGQFL